LSRGRASYGGEPQKRGVTVPGRTPQKMKTATKSSNTELERSNPSILYESKKHHSLIITTIQYERENEFQCGLFGGPGKGKYAGHLGELLIIGGVITKRGMRREINS